MEKTLANIPRSNQPVEIQSNQGDDTSSTNDIAEGSPTNYIDSRSESHSQKKLNEFEVKKDNNYLNKLPLEVISKIVDFLDRKDILNLKAAYPEMEENINYVVRRYIDHRDLKYIEALVSKCWHSMLEGVIGDIIFRYHPLGKLSVDNLTIDCSPMPMGYEFTTKNPFSEDYKGKIRVHIDGNTLTINKVIDGDITSFKDTMMHIPHKYVVMNNGNAIIFEYKDRDSPKNFYCVYYIKDSRLKKLFIDYPNKDEFEFKIINNAYPYESNNKELIILTNDYRFIIQGIVFENDAPKVVTLLDIYNSSKIFMRLENIYFSYTSPFTSNDGKVIIQEFQTPLNLNSYAARRHVLILKLEGDVYKPYEKIMYDIQRCDISFSGVYITTLYKENKELWIYDLQNDNKQLLSKNVKTYVMNHDENMIIFTTIDEEEAELLHLYNYNKKNGLWEEDNNISKQLDDAAKHINKEIISITNGDDTLIIKGTITEAEVAKKVVQVLSLNNLETEARNIVQLYEACSEKSYYPRIIMTLNGLMFVTNYSPREIKIYTYDKHRTKLNIRATISLDTARSEHLRYLDPYGRFIKLSSERIIKLDKLGTREV